jgi:glycosyltransferase involved in cell wall biosynthesis
MIKLWFGVVIFTRNEEIHIARCLRSLMWVASKNYIVDSFSTDQTVVIAKNLRTDVVQQRWKNYADPFQWGLDICGLDSDWVILTLSV